MDGRVGSEEPQRLGLDLLEQLVTSLLLVVPVIVLLGLLLQPHPVG